MFKKNLYITRGINENLPQKLINLLWVKVQGVDNRKLDYLQVFEFENKGTKDKPKLLVKWSQEVPEHTETFEVDNISTDVEKVWIICTAENTPDEYSTMLLPEEY